LIGPNFMMREHILRNPNGRPSVRPAGVKREMRDDLRNLAWLNTMIERVVEMEMHRDGLVARD